MRRISPARPRRTAPRSRLGIRYVSTRHPAPRGRPRAKDPRALTLSSMRSFAPATVHRAAPDPLIRGKTRGSALQQRREGGAVPGSPRHRRVRVQTPSSCRGDRRVVPPLPTRAVRRTCVDRVVLLPPWNGRRDPRRALRYAPARGRPPRDAAPKPTDTRELHPCPRSGSVELLEAGVHFGHQTRRWNPKMRRFIHGGSAALAGGNSQ